jgi:diacylglycerol kinase
MSEMHPPRRRTWYDKFRDAARGLLVAVREDSSYTAHAVAACAVIGAATLLGVTRVEWCVLIICISLVVTAELLNSSLEHLAKAGGQIRSAHPRRAGYRQRGRAGRIRRCRRRRLHRLPAVRLEPVVSVALVQ